MRKIKQKISENKNTWYNKFKVRSERNEKNKNIYNSIDGINFDRM